MSRVRRRLWLFLVTVSGGLVASWLVVGAMAHAAEAPTVTFVKEGGQGSCTSVPTVSSLTVPFGTGVVVVNETGRPANLYVGGTSLMRVDNGRGVALTLAAGQHDLRLAPSCLKYADAPMLAVTVLWTGPSTGTSSTGASSATSTGGSSGGGSSGESTGTTQPAVAPATATSSRPAPSGSRRTAASGTGTPSTTSAESPSVVTASAFGTPSHGEVNGVSTTAPAGVISARPLALPDEDHPKGLRLLATIATICVLGVTAAIIRAIVRLSP